MPWTAAVPCFLLRNKNNGVKCCGTSFLAMAKKPLLRHNELGRSMKNYAMARCNMLWNAAASRFMLRHEETMARNAMQCCSALFLDVAKE